MRIHIRHRTVYRYAEPVVHGVQYLRLTPRSSTAQSVDHWHVDAPGRVTQWTDHFGNLCHTLAVDRVADAISVVVAAFDKTFDTHGVMQVSTPNVPLVAYLNATAYTRTDAAVEAFAAGFRPAMDKRRLDGLHDLMLGVGEAVVYREGETHVHTTAAEALEDGYGVCQDQAHLFIAACKLLDIPARYVSGYLWSGGAAEAHDAGHAWAEAHVPDLGWVSFDPANSVSATDRYVRLAVGFDYAGAGPIRGIRRGGGVEAMEVAIDLQGQQ